MPTYEMTPDEMAKQLVKSVQSAPMEDQTKTPEFGQWFGKSKVVDDAGKPAVLYHVSKSADVTDFNPLSHFGTKEQAYSLFAGRLRRGEQPSKATYPVYVKAENPLRIEDRQNNSVQSMLEQTNPELAKQMNDEIRE